MEKTVISKDGRFEWDEEKNEINQHTPTQEAPEY